MKINTIDLYNRIIHHIETNGPKTREQLFEVFNIPFGTLSGRCNDLMKLKILTQIKKVATKTGHKAYLLQLNPKREEWLPYNLLKREQITDNKIDIVIKILKKSSNPRQVFNNIIRQIPYNKLVRTLKGIT